jgi:hypothetical protein
MWNERNSDDFTAIIFVSGMKLIPLVHLREYFFVAFVPLKM